MKNKLLFYNEYEQFYKMAESSAAFRKFCKDAFGADFSQDGFSNLSQINKILNYIPENTDTHILDIGCGNGKMLGYLQSCKDFFIHGFDYSDYAIKTAKKLYPKKSDFKVGVIGEVVYPSNYFDLAISMDTMYFAKDMTDFVSQIKSWLKNDGVLFVGYQEGDVMPKTDNCETTEIAKSLRQNDFNFKVIDLTEETYYLLKKKRESAIMHKADFETEGNTNWYDMLIAQTNYADCSLDEFKEKMARYIYIATKE